MANKIRTARDPAGLAPVVIWATWAYLGANLLVTIANFVELGDLMKLPPETLVDYDDDTMISGRTAFLVFTSSVLLLISWAIAGFLILKWIYRVNLNAAVWARGKTIAPAWSVGWFFVPFANLLMPFRAMAETWRITHRTKPGPAEDAPDLLKWWWGLFLLANILNNAAGQLGRSELAGAMVLGSELVIVASLVTIPLCIILVRVVRRLSAAQSARLARGEPAPEAMAELEAAPA